MTAGDSHPSADPAVRAIAICCAAFIAGLLGSAVLVTAYFLAIIALVWPQFIPRLRAKFHY